MKTKLMPMDELTNMLANGILDQLLSTDIAKNHEVTTKVLTDVAEMYDTANCQPARRVMDKIYKIESMLQPDIMVMH